ncbi:hypothetical protein N9N67_11850, partial [Bacteriovoracaceae bacterium]|nr:hypothetical protein [Bacteriovoracaceae bacterium]
MKSILNPFVLFLIIAFSIYSSFGLEKHATVTLNKYKDGNKSYLVLNVLNEDHWHTYWKNPGDAGLSWV